MALVLGLFWCIHTEQNRDRGRNRNRDQNNGGQFQYQSRCNLKASTEFHTTHLFPVPISVPASVNTPLVLAPVHGHAIMATLTKSLLIGTTKILLPPANEVWGKVIFSQASVILYTVEGSLSGGGGLSRGVYVWRDLSREGLCPRGYSKGVSVSEWAVCILLECILTCIYLQTVEVNKGCYITITVNGYHQQSYLLMVTI